MMAARVERIQDSERGIGFRVSLPDSGDSYTSRMLPEYGAILQWDKGEVSWAATVEVTAQANAGDLPLKARYWRPIEQGEIRARPLAVSFAASAADQTAILWTEVDLRFDEPVEGPP